MEQLMDIVILYIHGFYMILLNTPKISPDFPGFLGYQGIQRGPISKDFRNGLFEAPIARISLS